MCISCIRFLPFFAFQLLSNPSQHYWETGFGLKRVLVHLGFTQQPFAHPRYMSQFVNPFSLQTTTCVVAVCNLNRKLGMQPENPTRAAHPDPTGVQLQRLVPVLESMVRSCTHGIHPKSPYERPAVWGVFWDYLSLHQHPAHLKGRSGGI